MEGGPLSSPKFKEFSEDYVLFCHITSKVPGEKYGNLLQEKGGRGFPFLVYMNDGGDVVASGFGRSVTAFSRAGEKATKAVRRLEDLEKKAAEGDMGAKVELFLLEVEMGRYVTYGEAMKVRSTLELNENQNAAADAAMIDLELGALVQKQRGGKDVLARLLEIDAAGLTPRTDSGASFLWSQLLDHWEEKVDVDKFATTLKKLETHFRGNARFRMYRDMKRATLERLKKKKADPEG